MFIVSGQAFMQMAQPAALAQEPAWSEIDGKYVLLSYN